MKALNSFTATKAPRKQAAYTAPTSTIFLNTIRPLSFTIEAAFCLTAVFVFVVFMTVCLVG